MKLETFWLVLPKIPIIIIIIIIIRDARYLSDR